jgi:pimeloyl-ACP methyl ester carboxylesterase
MTLPPVLLVHGLASSFAHNWQATGWADILRDEGREVLGVDLPGHGTSASVDPASVTAADAVLAALGEHPLADAAGFSAGGQALLAAAAAAPHRFRRLAVLGVGNPREGTEAEDADDASARLADGLSADETPAHPVTRLMRRLAQTAGNDRHAVAAFLRTQRRAVPLAHLALVTVPVLVVLGDKDFAAPADRLLGALPDARLVMLRGVDHFGTPLSYDAIAAVTSFLAEP